MQTSVSHIVQLYCNLGWPVSSHHEDATNTPGRAKATTHAGAPRSGTGELRSAKQKKKSPLNTIQIYSYGITIRYPTMHMCICIYVLLLIEYCNYKYSMTCEADRSTLLYKYKY